MWFLLALLFQTNAQHPAVPVISSNFSSTVYLTVVNRADPTNMTSTVGRFYQYEGLDFQASLELLNLTQTVASLSRWTGGKGATYVIFSQPQPTCQVQPQPKSFNSLFSWVPNSKFLRQDIVMGVECNIFGLSNVLTLAYPSNPGEQGWGPRRMVMATSDAAVIFDFDDFEEGVDPSQFTVPPFCKTGDVQTPETPLSMMNLFQKVLTTVQQ